MNAQGIYPVSKSAEDAAAAKRAPAPVFIGTPRQNPQPVSFAPALSAVPKAAEAPPAAAACAPPPVLQNAGTAPALDAPNISRSEAPTF